MLHAAVHIEVHVGFAGFAPLGSDDHYAVGCAHPVNSRGRGILQDVNALDVVGADSVELVFTALGKRKAVDHVQRVIIASGSDTPDPNGRTSCTTRGAAVRSNRDARHSALQGLGGIGYGLANNFRAPTPMIRRPLRCRAPGCRSLPPLLRSGPAGSSVRVTFRLVVAPVTGTSWRGEAYVAEQPGVLLSGAFRREAPSALVVVPMVVPFTVMVTPGKGRRFLGLRGPKRAHRPAHYGW